MTGPADIGDRPDLSHAQILRIFSGLMTGLFLAAVDQTIVATALPTIVGELGDLSQLSWVVTGYLITSTASTPLYGKLGDLYGRRVVFQVAIGIFVAGSILCAVSTSMFQLIAARALQGVGGGGLMAMAFTIVGDILAPRQRGRYMGYFTSVFAVAGVAGPVLGGFFVDQLTWRWIFWVNLPFGAVAMVVVTRNLRLPLPTLERKIDYLGGALLVASVTALMFVSVWGGGRFEWASPQIAGLTSVGLLLGALFVVQERRAPEPMLPLRLFRNPVVRTAVAIGFVISAGMFVTTVFMPLFLQAVVGMSATSSGLYIAPTMLGVTLSSLFAGRRMTATGRYKRYLVTGAIVAGAMISGLTQVSESTPGLAISAAMFGIGLGSGMVFPILNMASQNAVDFRDIGTATSTVRFSQSLGGTFAVAAAGAVLTAGLQSHLDSLAGDPDFAAVAGQLDAAEIAGSPEAIRALPEQLQAAVIDGLAGGVSRVFILALPLVVLAIVLSLRIKEIPLRTTIATSPRSGPPVPPPGVPVPPTDPSDGVAPAPAVGAEPEHP